MGKKSKVGKKSLKWAKTILLHQLTCSIIQTALHVNSLYMYLPLNVLLLTPLPSELREQLDVLAVVKTE